MEIPVFHAKRLSIGIFLTAQNKKAAVPVLEVKNPSAIGFKINSGWIFQWS